MKLNFRKSLTCLSVFIIFCSLTTSQVYASEHVGVVAIAVDVRVEGHGELNINDDINEGDVLITGPHGSLTILFNDESILTLGPNARARLVSFFEGGISLPGHSEINILAGRFNYLPGHILELGGIQIVINENSVASIYAITPVAHAPSHDDLTRTGEIQTPHIKITKTRGKPQKNTLEKSIKHIRVNNNTEETEPLIVNADNQKKEFVSSGSTANSRFTDGAFLVVPQGIDPVFRRTVPIDVAVATEIGAIEIEAIEIEPVEFEPIEIESVEFEPIEIEPVEFEPIEIEPIELAEVEPIEIEPVEIE